MTLQKLGWLACVTLPLMAAQALEAPVIPAAAKEIEVRPYGEVKLKYHFLAVGKQIYKCESGVWGKASTPDAILYDAHSGLKVRHGAGPSWSFENGKGTIKGIGPTAVHFASPDGVSIDWLKLDVDRASRSGDFSDVGIVQRLYTGGGKAPTTGCSGNQSYDSPYTAHYYFWVAK